MSIKSPARKKATDHSSTESDDRALIDEATIRRLDDAEPDTDAPTCRFAAVARSLEHVSAPNTQFSIPVTIVAYIDESGEYGIEREYIGHRPDWSGIPRTIGVTADAPVRGIPDRHSARYAPILAIYERVLAEA